MKNDEPGGTFTKKCQQMLHLQPLKRKQSRESIALQFQLFAENDISRADPSSCWLKKMIGGRS